MQAPTPPNYVGRGLVNLVAELETRLAGVSASGRLDTDLADLIPIGDTYVLVLFDGLGVSQLTHRGAAELKASHVGTIDVPFPSMTTVSLATIATGTPPSRHGLTSYKLWLAEHQTVVNTIHMTTAWGEAIPDLDATNLLPSPNLWERLTRAGVEPIAVQPGNFASTPLTQCLYRGARFEGYWSSDEAIDIVLDLTREPGRLIMLYVPFVDFAAHVSGQDSPEYDEAIRTANAMWDRLTSRVGERTVVVGTADHGHVDVPESMRTRLAPDAVRDGFVSEDGRVLFLHGPSAVTDGPRIADQYDGAWVETASGDSWWGDVPPDARFLDRLPAGIVFLPPLTAAFADHGNPRLIGNHGGLEPSEREVPILVGRRSGND